MLADVLHRIGLTEDRLKLRAQVSMFATQLRLQ